MGQRGLRSRGLALAAAASLSLSAPGAFAQDPSGADATPAGESAAGGLTNAFGDAGADLVFTPVTPCRLFDTRLTAAGMLVANTQRNFWVAGTANFPAQGGNSGGCAIPAAGASAIVVNLAAVTPTSTGNLRAFAATNPAPAAPLAAVVNFSPQLYALANGVVVPICNSAVTSCPAGHLRLQADDASVHVVGDVMGYFHRPIYKTMSGMISARYVPHVPNSFLLTGASYPMPIPTATWLPTMEYVVGPGTTNCPSVGAARPQYLCVYGLTYDNVAFAQLSAGGNTRFGFSIDVFMQNPAVPGYLVATWTLGLP